MEYSRAKPCFVGLRSNGAIRRRWQHDGFAHSDSSESAIALHVVGHAVLPVWDVQPTIPSQSGSQGIRTQHKYRVDSGGPFANLDMDSRRVKHLASSSPKLMVRSEADSRQRLLWGHDDPFADTC